MHVYDHFRRSPFQNLQMVNVNFSGSEFHLFPLASHLVSFTPMDLYRGKGRWSLLDLANIALKNLVELFLGHIHRRGGRSACKVSFGIIGIRGIPETQDGLVALVGSRDKFAQADGGSDQDDEYSGSTRV